tara:strand:- start:4804 stop:5448 length:645 start_codon:yes stop_codon:yes gene_type:complete
MNAQDHVRKGTTTIGMLCKGGVVMAADKRATIGGHIVVEKNIDKVLKLTDNIAITVAGSVSDIQLLVKLIGAELNLKKIRTGKDASVKEAANLLGMMVYNNIRKFSTIMGITGFLMGGVDQSGVHLYNIGVDGSVTESDGYTADGSGFMMALGVLDTLYKKDAPVADGVKLGVQAINAAMQRDAATGEGIDVVTVTKDGVKKVFAKKVDSFVRV